MTDHHSTLGTIGESLADAGFDPECLSRSPLDQPIGLYADAQASCAIMAEERSAA